MNEILAIPTDPVQSLPNPTPDALLLSEILVNQHEILKNQRVMMEEAKNRRIWGIIKIVIIAAFIIGPLFFLPAMIDSMMGEFLPKTAGSNTSVLSGFDFKSLIGDPDTLLKEMMNQ